MGWWLQPPALPFQLFSAANLLNDLLTHIPMDHWDTLVVMPHPCARRFQMGWISEAGDRNLFAAVDLRKPASIPHMQDLLGRPVSCLRVVARSITDALATSLTGQRTRPQVVVPEMWTTIDDALPLIHRVLIRDRTGSPRMGFPGDVMAPHGTDVIVLPVGFAWTSWSARGTPRGPPELPLKPNMAGLRSRNPRD